MGSSRVNCLALIVFSGTKWTNALGGVSPSQGGVAIKDDFRGFDCVIRQFFAQLGMTQVRFKPAFNPYTELSMEIFAFHPMLKCVEGAPGMFRPEMLLPMGLPEDVNESRGV